jgi:hypothetical protein
VQIDVQLGDTAAAAAAAAELALSVRQSAGRLDAACPPESGSPLLAAWRSTWLTLRTGLLGIATAAEGLATVGGAAVASMRATESAVIAPDDH